MATAIRFLVPLIIAAFTLKSLLQGDAAPGLNVPGLPRPLVALVVSLSVFWCTFRVMRIYFQRAGEDERKP
ncbi:MAG TPA: hypothetical protein VHG35_02575 [Gemmatimonadales bacterium]|nr:hypothetical protein [Gemmatimonadales bacterium]